MSRPGKSPCYRRAQGLALLPTYLPTFNAKLAEKSNSKLEYIRETRLLRPPGAPAAGHFPHIIEIANLPTFSRPSLHYSLSFSLSYFYIWKRLAGWQHAPRARARRGREGSQSSSSMLARLAEQ